MTSTSSYQPDVNRLDSIFDSRSKQAEANTNNSDDGTQEKSREKGDQSSSIQTRSTQAEELRKKFNPQEVEGSGKDIPGEEESNSQSYSSQEYVDRVFSV